MKDLKTAAWLCVPPLAAFLTEAGPDAPPLCPSEPVADYAEAAVSLGERSSYSAVPAVSGGGLKASSTTKLAPEASINPCVTNTWWERLRRKSDFELIFDFTIAGVALMAFGLGVEWVNKRSWLAKYVDEAGSHFVVAYLLARQFVDRTPKLRGAPVRTLEDAQACRIAIQELDEAIAIYERHGLNNLKWVWNVRTDEEYRFMRDMRDELDKKMRAFAESESRRRSEQFIPRPTPSAVKSACAVLGIADTASYEEARSAFRRMVNKVHPDKNSDDPLAEQKFKEVYAAFKTLCRAKGWRQGPPASAAKPAVKPTLTAY